MKVTTFCYDQKPPLQSLRPFLKVTMTSPDIRSIWPPEWIWLPHNDIHHTQLPYTHPWKLLQLVANFLQINIQMYIIIIFNKYFLQIRSIFCPLPLKTYSLFTILTTSNYFCVLLTSYSSLKVILFTSIFSSKLHQLLSCTVKNMFIMDNF